jgi:hypothetical protein
MEDESTRVLRTSKQPLKNAADRQHDSVATTTPEESDPEKHDYSCNSDAISYDRTAKLLRMEDD